MVLNASRYCRHTKVAVRTTILLVLCYRMKLSCDYEAVLSFNHTFCLRLVVFVVSFFTWRKRQRVVKEFSRISVCCLSVQRKVSPKLHYPAVEEYSCHMCWIDLGSEDRLCQFRKQVCYYDHMTIFLGAVLGSGTNMEMAMKSMHLQLGKAESSAVAWIEIHSGGMSAIGIKLCTHHLPCVAKQVLSNHVVHSL